MKKQSEISIHIVLSAFSYYLKATSKLLEELSDEQLRQEIAPTKNTGHYILGHLVAVHDAIIPLLDLGERLYPELEDVFINNPDKSGIQKPGVTQIRENWNEVNTLLLEKLATLSTDQWFEKHNAISAEDFVKEPHRNRLNVVSNRTNHLAYHLGQLALLKK
jgi:uncharacterized damage-inducible protein DinB